MSKKKIYTGGLIYSTNPEVLQPEAEEIQDTLAPEQQYLKVVLDSKKRAGKVVTLIAGFVGTPNDLEALGKILKTKCGTGGTAKDGEILIQGDYKLKVIEWLKQMKYHVK